MRLSSRSRFHAKRLPGQTCPCRTIVGGRRAVRAAARPPRRRLFTNEEGEDPEEKYMDWIDEDAPAGSPSQPSSPRSGLDPNLTREVCGDG